MSQDVRAGVRNEIGYRDAFPSKTEIISKVHSTKYIFVSFFTLSQKFIQKVLFIKWSKDLPAEGEREKINYRDVL